jgi:hypothetical protein
MSKTEVDPLNAGEQGLRTYRGPWKGQILLACRKCQKKLKQDGKKNGIAKLGKAIKKRAKRHEDSADLRLVQVSCLKLCPKGAVTVCTQQQLSRNECSIVRTLADIDLLLAACPARSYQLIDGGRNSANSSS